MQPAPSSFTRSSRRSGGARRVHSICTVPVSVRGAMPWTIAFSTSGCRVSGGIVSSAAAVVDLPDHRQPRAEAQRLQAEVVAHEIELLAQRHAVGGAAVGVEQVAQHPREAQQGALGRGGVLARQEDDRVEGVEEEVRIELAADRRQLGPHQPRLGLGREQRGAMGAAGVQRAAEARDQRGVDEHRPGACARAPAARRSRPHGRGRRTSWRGRSRADARARRRRARRAHGRRPGPAPAARAAAASAPTAAPACRAASAAPGSRWLRRPLPRPARSRGRHRCRRWRRAASRAGTGPRSRARAGDRRGRRDDGLGQGPKRALACGDRRRHGELGGQRGDESPAAVAEPSAPGNERLAPQP